MFWSFQTSLSIFTFVTFLASSSSQNTTCQSTGHRCILPEQCASQSLANGQYQWCGGCQKNVRCQGGVGELFDWYNPSFTQWDDNRKNYEMTSTTCVECYYPCPDGASAPPQPVCDRTGLGCLTNTCPSGVNGNFQYCGYCTHYVQCSISGGFSLTICPQGTYYDDIARTCLPSSTTCRQCYDTCYEPTTVIPTTSQPTTVQPTTVRPSNLQPTTESENGQGGTKDTQDPDFTGDGHGGGNGSTTAAPTTTTSSGVPGAVASIHSFVFSVVVLFRIF